jgi:hypothetical protein
MRSLARLLAVGLDEATEAVKAEAEGECGPPEVPPEDVSAFALKQAALVAQAEAVCNAASVRTAPCTSWRLFGWFGVTFTVYCALVLKDTNRGLSKTIFLGSRIPLA